MPGPSPFATYPSLEGKIVIVTGGASGIGEAIVAAFAMQHAQVVFIDIQDAAAEHLIQRLTANGLPAPAYYRCDLTGIAALQQTVESILTRFKTVDVLVNNAANDARHTIDEVTSEWWDRSIAVNLKHQFFMAQSVASAMRKVRRGSIINMGSISWLIPSANVPVYSTAKAAIVGMTRSLAHELGPHNIRVNCVMPGAVLTERQQRLWFTEEYKAEILASQALKRLILPEDVARLVLFLAADDSSAITNQCHIIDAGWV